jgi:large subunit ribosomal protein L25
MDIGDTVHASDLRLPQGVTLQVEPDTLVLHVIAQQGGEPEEEEAAEGAPEAPEALAESDAGDRRGDEEQAG